MAVTPMKPRKMTKMNEGGRSLAPRNNKAIDEPADNALRDPITVATEIAAGDLSVAELVAFRRQPLDLESAARNAKNLHSEAFRVWLARESGDEIAEAVCGGLKIMSISLISGPPTTSPPPRQNARSTR